MRRKDYLLLPALEVEGTGKLIRVQEKDGILCMDCYKGGKYRGRHFLRVSDGKHWSFRDGVWHEENLVSTFGYDASIYDLHDIKVELANPEEEELVCSMLPEKWKYARWYYGGKSDAIRRIGNSERNYDAMKRENARKRKTERINALMDRVPTLPDDFEQWCWKVMDMTEVMFYEKEKEVYHCTACGKSHKPKEKLKHNQSFTCPKTRKTVVVKKRQRFILTKDRAMILQSLGEDYSVARHFLIQFEQQKDGTEFHAYEEVRYILPKQNSNLQIYYGQYPRADEFKQDWWDTNPQGKHCYAEYCYPDTREALKGTWYAKQGIEAMASMGWKIQYNKLMANHYNSAFFEYIVKAGLRNLAEDLSNRFSCWGGFYCSDIDREGENASEVLGISMQRFHRLKQNNGNLRYLRWLKYEEETEEKIPEETIQFFIGAGIDPVDVQFIADRITAVKIHNYLNRQIKQSKKSAKYILDLWEDYLSMAKRMGMDTGDEIVYRTKKLIRRHDELVEALAQQSEDKAAAEMQKKYPKCNDICRQIREKYEYRNEKYVMTVPTGIQDIMRDSRQLHHCAGSSERYFERINNRETFILFLRKADRPLHAFYTIETEPDGTVRQKRSEYNRQPEKEEVSRFLREWQQAVRQRLKEEDKLLSDRSRKLREEEMKELEEQGNTRLLQTLAEDLMEINIA